MPGPLRQLTGPSLPIMAQLMEARVKSRAASLFAETGARLLVSGAAAVMAARREETTMNFISKIVMRMSERKCL